VTPESLDDRQREGRRLARARLRRTNHIAAREHHRNGLRLDWRGIVVAHLLHREGDRVVEAELRKRRVHLRHVGRRKRRALRSERGLVALFGALMRLRVRVATVTLSTRRLWPG
jgi:hypothetical protein